MFRRALYGVTALTRLNYQHSYPLSRVVEWDVGGCKGLHGFV